MNRQGNNLIGFQFNSIQFNFEKNYRNELFFEKKFRLRIDSLNSMHDHESPKVSVVS